MGRMFDLCNCILLNCLRYTGHYNKWFTYLLLREEDDGESEGGGGGDGVLYYTQPSNIVLYQNCLHVYS